MHAVRPRFHSRSRQPAGQRRSAPSATAKRAAAAARAEAVSASACQLAGSAGPRPTLRPSFTQREPGYSASCSSRAWRFLLQTERPGGALVAVPFRCGAARPRRPAAVCGDLGCPGGVSASRAHSVLSRNVLFQLGHFGFVAFGHLARVLLLARPVPPAASTMRAPRSVEFRGSAPRPTGCSASETPPSASREHAPAAAMLAVEFGQSCWAFSSHRFLVASLALRAGRCAARARAARWRRAARRRKSGCRSAGGGRTPPRRSAIRPARGSPASTRTSTVWPASCGWNVTPSTWFSRNSETCGKTRFQLGAELLEFEFVDVERVGAFAPARFGVVELVGRGDDELAGGRQHAARFRQELAPVVQVLDHLEGHHQVEAGIGMRQRGRRKPARSAVGQRGSGRGRNPRLRRRRSTPTTECAPRRQFGRAVAGAAAGVQHALAARQAGGEGVARQVLVEQVDIHLAGNHALAGEFSQGVSPWRRSRPRPGGR